jgi:CheY-like chemotaxis protein
MTLLPFDMIGRNCCTRKNGARTLTAKSLSKSSTVELQALPVVAVTAFAMRGDEERIRESGCKAYLSKPIPVAKFVETIRRFLGVGLSMPAVRRD